jgi:hypothetical protein
MHYSIILLNCIYIGNSLLGHLQTYNPLLMRILRLRRQLSLLLKSLDYATDIFRSICLSKIEIFDLGYVFWFIDEGKKISKQFYDLRIS